MIMMLMLTMLMLTTLQAVISLSNGINSFPPPPDYRPALRQCCRVHKCFVLLCICAPDKSMIDTMTAVEVLMMALVVAVMVMVRMMNVWLD